MAGLPKRIRVIVVTALAFAALMNVPLIPTAAEDADTVFTCFINHAWYPVSSFTGVIPDEITRLTGVRLDVSIAKDTRQLNMMLAADALPELVFTASQFDALSSADVCYDYDALIDAYGVDWTIPEDLRSNAMIFSQDDKLYTVINYYTQTEDWADSKAVPMTASLMARQDMLDGMGNPPLRTLDDLMDVYQRVLDEFPGVYPLMFDAYHRFNVFRVYFGLGLTEFCEQSDGSYAFFARDERYCAMLAYLNRLYRLGGIPIENFAATNSQESVPYKAGRAFSYSGCTQNANIYMDSALKMIDSQYHSVELPPFTGSSYTNSSLGWSGAFITKQCRDPGMAIQFIRWMFTPQAQRLTQWGREGVDYTLNENRLPVFAPELLDTLRANTYTQLYNPWFHFGSSAVLESEGRCALLPFEDYSDTYDRIRELYANEPWITAAAPMADDPQKRVYDRVTSSANEWETYIIVSETEDVFAARWDEYQDYLARSGADALEAAMNIAIPARKAGYNPGYNQ